MITLPDLPRWAWGAIAVALLGIAFFMWLAWHDGEVIEDHETVVTGQVERLDAAGDAAGVERAEGVRERIEAGNAQASEAAVGSDDPLKTGMDALR